MELVLTDTQNPLIVDDAIFCCEFNEALIHQIITAYLATARSGTKAQKNRAEVTGSGKKPWRQKGTGRARSGSVKSPIWRSGGVTFAARPQDYSQKVNKKMYRGALKSILSESIRQNRLLVMETFSIEEPKTKLLIKKLKNMNLQSVLIITNIFEKNLFLAARNLQKICICHINNTNPIHLLSFDKILMTARAIKKLEEVLA